MGSSTSTFEAEAVSLWTCQLPGAPSHLFPPIRGRCNPLAAGRLVIFTRFSPGILIALERDTGNLAWELELPGYGSNAGTTDGETFFGGSVTTLFAIELDTGSVRWSFAPTTSSREAIYSAPTLAGDLVIIGDRAGLLHALDRETGQPVWSVLTSEKSNNQVNGVPVVSGDSVLVTDNTRCLHCFDYASGERRWRTELDDFESGEPRLHQGALWLTTQRSVSAYSVVDGSLQSRWQIPGWSLSGFAGLATGGSNAACVVEDERKHVDGFPWTALEVPRVVGMRPDGITWSRKARKFGAPYLQCDLAGNLLYEAGLGTLTIRRMESGKRLAQIRFPSTDRDDTRVSVPAILGDRIFAATETAVWALRNPAL